MKLTPHQTAFTKDIARLIHRATAMGVDLTFGEAFRTQDQQLLYYHNITIRPEDRVLQKVNKDPRTRSRYSNHTRRLAVDFNFFINGELNYTHPKVAALGHYWESLSPLNRWGGNFAGFFDAPHFERVPDLKSRIRHAEEPDPDAFEDTDQDEEEGGQIRMEFRPQGGSRLV